MIVFAIIAGIFLLLFAVFLFLPSQFGLEYEYKDGVQRLVLHIRCLGIPLKIKIPLSKHAEQGKEKKKKEAEAVESFKKKMTFSRFRSIASGMKKAYRETEGDIADILSQIRQKTSFESICFTLNFGLSNAAKTGIATGAAWASSSCVLSVLDRMFGIKKMYLDVVPDFNREHFHLYLKSILRLRPVHIISIGIRMIKIVNLFIEKMDIK